jgi:hypothetical protein
MRKSRPSRFLLFLAGCMALALESNGQEIHSFGIFTGFTSPYTIDNGIAKDPRYKNSYNVKFLPIGFHYGVDLAGFGFMVDPQIMQVGQNFIVTNTVGGHVGKRESNLLYAQLPVGFKLHMIDLSFFRVSFVGSVGMGILLDAKETIRHDASKLYFPAKVYPTLQNDERYKDSYTIVYDGVLVPKANLTLAKKSDFRSFQFFGALGLRSDWDITEDWRISFDLRANYSFLDARSDAYVKSIRNHEAVYDQYGERRELFLSLTLGIARTLEISPKEKKRSPPKIKPFRGRRSPK